MLDLEVPLSLARKGVDFMKTFQIQILPIPFFRQKKLSEENDFMSRGHFQVRELVDASSRRMVARLLSIQSHMPPHTFAKHQQQYDLVRGPTISAPEVPAITLGHAGQLQMGWSISV